jgi:hypothetical protein
MSSIPFERSFGHQRAVDDLVSAYVDWREECRRVWDADRRWTSTHAEESIGADCAYQAALDREEAAAKVYANLVARVARSESRSL